MVAGIDFGKRHLRMAISDLSHQLLAERHRTLDVDLPATEAIRVARRMFEDALDEAGVRSEELVGVGMGLPGPVHRPSGELGNSTILPGWVGVRASDAVSAALGHAVQVENDANLGALGEWMWGAGRGADHMAYVKARPASAPGSSSPASRTWAPVAPRARSAIPSIDPGGPICRCGNRGCLETLAGAPAVLGSLRDVHSDDLTLSEAVAYALRGDAGCQRAIADAGAAIGTAVATLCNLFNPHRVIVGGRSRRRRRAAARPDPGLAGARRDSLRGRRRRGRSGRARGARRGVRGCCARVRARRSRHHLLTPAYLARNTSNSQIVASLRINWRKGRT